MDHRINPHLPAVLYRILLCLALLATSALATSVFGLGAQTHNSQLDGPQIAWRSFQLAKPESLKMRVQLILIPAVKSVKRFRNVEITQRELQSELQNNESVQFIEFLSPQDVRGTKFLSRKRARPGSGKQITETRMFTPADQRIRSITSSSRKNSFMGTDFSYYDLEQHDYEDFSFRLQARNQQIPDTSFAGKSFYVLEARPKDSKNAAAPYNKMHYWVDQQNFQIRRIEAFANGVKVKDIYVLQNVANTDYFIPRILLAINYQKNGHRTVWQVQDIEINPAVDERVFSVQNLN